MHTRRRSILLAGLASLTPATLAQTPAPAKYREQIGTTLLRTGPLGEFEQYPLVRVTTSSDPTTTIEQLRIFAQMSDAALASPDVVQINRQGPFATRGGGLDVIFDVNLTNAPSGTAAAISAVEAYLESIIQTDATIRVGVSFTPASGGPLFSVGLTVINDVPYASVRSALVSSMDTDDFIQRSLPTSFSTRLDATSLTSTPVPDMDVAHALGVALLGANNATIIGSVQFNINFGVWDTDPSDGISTGAHSFRDVLLQQVVGMMGMDTSISGGANFDKPTPMDLFRFPITGGGGIIAPRTLQEFAVVPRETAANAQPNTRVLNFICGALQTDNTSPSRLVQVGAPFSLMENQVFQGYSLAPTYFSDNDLLLLDAVGWNIFGAGMAPQRRQRKTDWNGDGWPDIFFDQKTTNPPGFAATIHLSGYQYRSWELRRVADAGSGWRRVPINVDINNDGHPDMLWRLGTSTTMAVWFMNPTNSRQVQAWDYLPVLPSADFEVQAGGDLNADGYADLLLRNQTTGYNAIWYMSATGYDSWAPFPSQGSPTMRMVGAADFDQDGKTDILWRDNTSGLNFLWSMDNTAFLSALRLPNVAAPWVVKGVGDWNGDKKADIFWWNTTTGATAFWFMDGTAFSSWELGPTIDPATVE